MGAKNWGNPPVMNSVPFSVLHFSVTYLWFNDLNVCLWLNYAYVCNVACAERRLA